MGIINKIFKNKKYDFDKIPNHIVNYDVHDMWPSMIMFGKQEDKPYKVVGEGKLDGQNVKFVVIDEFHELFDDETKKQLDELILKGASSNRYEIIKIKREAKMTKKEMKRKIEKLEVLVESLLCRVDTIATQSVDTHEQVKGITNFLDKDIVVTKCCGVMWNNKEKHKIEYKTSSELLSCNFSFYTNRRGIEIEIINNSDKYFIIKATGIKCGTGDELYIEYVKVTKGDGKVEQINPVEIHKMAESLKGE